MTIPVGAPDRLAPSSRLPLKLDALAISRLDYIVFQPACAETLPESVGTDFTRLFTRADLQVFERQKPVPP